MLLWTSWESFRKVHNVVQNLKMAAKLNFVSHFSLNLCLQQRRHLGCSSWKHAPFYLLPVKRLVDSSSPLQRIVVYRGLLDSQHLRFSSNALVTLKMDSSIARFSFDKTPDEKCRDQTKVKEKAKRAKMSRKAKLNELRFYRLKAKKKMKSPNPEVRIRYKLEKKVLPYAIVSVKKMLANQRVVLTTICWPFRLKEKKNG
uniref:Late protein I226R n=1 Tax=Anthurium amnicola TaxID=1678845 RepID=A0A1D1Z4U3_9ARAE